MLDVKALLTKLLKRSIKVGTEINLGNVTLNASGYSQFNLGNSCPNGATVVSYKVLWSSATGAFAVHSYGTDRAQYIVGTPNAKITNLKLTPFYYL